MVAGQELEVLKLSLLRRVVVIMQNRRRRALKEDEAQPSGTSVRSQAFGNGVYGIRSEQWFEKRNDERRGG